MSAAPPATTMGDLALALQESFTVAVRLRANRQSAGDGVSFRAHVKSLLAGADRDARARGYDPEYVKLAVYAYIAYLDETVLNLSQPMFQEWTRQPLQEEVFGEHMAGENFFRYIADLMARQDSGELADVLEVYLLCLLLGYRGKYGMADPGSVQGIMMSIQQKIQRIRGSRAVLPPSWVLPPNEKVPAAADPWLRKLVLVAGATLLLALVLFVLYKLALGGSARGLRQLAQQLLGGG
jgi:type VI secretion system protein ImpK